MTQNDFPRLGDFIVEIDKRNTDNHPYPVLGLNKQKEFMPTVANLDGVDISKYKVVEKGNFVFSGMQTGRDVCIRIGLYTEDEPAVVSPAYTTFTIDESKDILSEYVFIFFCRDESDRYGWFISDSSIRSNLDWPRFLDIRIPHPDIDKQREIVNVWKSLKSLKEQNEKISEPLMALCRSKIQELKNTLPHISLSEHIEHNEERNENKYDLSSLRGISIEKKFIESKANMENVSLAPYLVIHPDDIAYVTITSRNGEKISIAHNDSDENYIVSSSYEAFHVKDTSKLIPSYLFLLLTRSEFDRYARFNSWGSAREAFSWEEMKRVKIPIPSIEVQRAIVDIYQCAQRAKTIAAEADQQLKTICPALIQYVINN